MLSAWGSLPAAVTVWGTRVGSSYKHYAGLLACTWASVLPIRLQGGLANPLMCPHLEEYICCLCWGIWPPAEVTRALGGQMSCKQVYWIQWTECFLYPVEYHWWQSPICPVCDHDSASAIVLWALGGTGLWLVHSFPDTSYINSLSDWPGPWWLIYCIAENFGGRKLWWIAS